MFCEKVCWVAVCAYFLYLDVAVGHFILALAAEITAAIEIPTIGIGAGLDCDGQVLVLHDLIGLSIDRIPRFVRSYADTKGTILDAVTSWRQDVESKKFPAESETLA